MSASRGSDAGFTLPEALVSLALLAMITTLSMSAVRQYTGILAILSGESLSGPYQDMRQVEKLIEQTTPATSVDPETGLSRLSFDGREDSLDFFTLSDGYALPGGPIRIRLASEATKQGTARIQLYYGDAASIAQAGTLSGPFAVSPSLSDLKLSYYGSKAAGEGPRWYQEWRDSERLPSRIRMIYAISSSRGSNPMESETSLHADISSR